MPTPGHMQVPTRSEHSSAFYRTKMREELPDALISRLRSNAAASTSGCDSSDCAYCQMAAQGPFADTLCAKRYSSIVRQRSSSSTAPSSPFHDVDYDDADCQALRCVPDMTPSSPAPISPTITSMRNFFHQQGGQHFTYRPQYHHQPVPIATQLKAVAQCVEPLQGQATMPLRRDMISSVEFSCCGRLIATGGVSKQLRIYSLTDCFDSEAATVMTAPLATIRTAYKISALAWSPRIDGMVTIGDYDGQLSQVHVGSGHMINEVDAHSGRRVWCAVHSRTAPSLILSTSDDKSARLWDDTCMSAPVATITPPGSSAICSADFHPRNQHLAALASSDQCVYLYDTRNCAAPLHVLAHHTKPVSFVKFMGNTQLVSASTDGSLALWRIPGAEGMQGGGCSTDDATAIYPDAQQQQQWHLKGLESWPQHLLRTFRGHTNERNFVGLSVLPEQQLLACGSEDPRVFTYCTAWADPLASADVPASAAAVALSPPHSPSSAALPLQQPQRRVGGQRQQRAGDVSKAGSPAFVSAVCWQGSEAAQNLGMPPLLAASTSAGDVRVFALLQ